ncbi:MAG: hypothetical protein KC656_30790, partial [Myxococcales bacterium]|nr:hypothetical protein [Myxococcales bacterium]
MRALREKLEALTGTSLRSPEHDTIDLRVHPDHAEALTGALDAVGLAGRRQTLDDQRHLVSIRAGESREDAEHRQALASLAAARLASQGVRVHVRGPRRPRQAELLGDQVVQPGTEALDYSVHRQVL